LAPPEFLRVCFPLLILSAVSWSGARVEWAVTRLTDKRRRRAVTSRALAARQRRLGNDCGTRRPAGAPCTVINVRRASDGAPCWSVTTLTSTARLHRSLCIFSLASQAATTRHHRLKSEAHYSANTNVSYARLLQLRLYVIS